MIVLGVWPQWHIVVWGGISTPFPDCHWALVGPEDKIELYPPSKGTGERWGGKVAIGWSDQRTRKIMRLAEKKWSYSNNSTIVSQKSAHTLYFLAVFHVDCIESKFTRMSTHLGVSFGWLMECTRGVWEIHPQALCMHIWGKKICAILHQK